MAKDAITVPLRRLPHSCSGKRLIWRWRAPAKKMTRMRRFSSCIGDFNLARIDLNSEAFQDAADKDQDKVNELNVKVNQLYNDISWQNGRAWPPTTRQRLNWSL